MEFNSIVTTKGMDYQSWTEITRQCRSLEEMTKGRLWVEVQKDGRAYVVSVHQVYPDSDSYTKVESIVRATSQVLTYLKGYVSGVAACRVITAIWQGR